MKNYFKFNLEGKQLLPVWVGMILFVIVPYILSVFRMGQQSANHELPTAMLLFLPVLFISLPIVCFYLTRIIIESVEYNGEKLKCDIQLVEFYKIFFVGTLLSIITLGIYSPWFITKVQSYVAEKTSYKSNEFIFMGEGLRLFGIITVTMIIPVIVMSVLAVIYSKRSPEEMTQVQIIRQIFTWIISVPYIYFLYKWTFNFKHKGFHIQWNTEALPSIGKIAKEMFFSIITIGIYLPMAYLKLYDYFIHKTESNIVDNQQIRFGYEVNAKEDYPYILGQFLLTLVTIGIYYPWAMANIGKRFLDKTYLNKLIIE